jgi:hypothetical protein
MFLFAGGAWLAARLPWRRAPGFVAAAGILIFAFETFSIPHEIHYGFTEAANFIDTHPDLHDDVILVSSDSDGEGLLISEVAMREKRLTHRILRATKALSRTDWNGGAYECFYQTPEDLMKFLRDANIGLVVLDTFPARIPYRHHAVILQAIKKYPQNWSLVGAFPDLPEPAAEGRVNLYRFVGKPAVGS